MFVTPKNPNSKRQHYQAHRSIHPYHVSSLYPKSHEEAEIGKESRFIYSLSKQRGKKIYVHLAILQLIENHEQRPENM